MHSTFVKKLTRKHISINPLHERRRFSTQISRIIKLLFSEFFKAIFLQNHRTCLDNDTVLK